MNNIDLNIFWMRLAEECGNAKIVCLHKEQVKKILEEWLKSYSYKKE